METSGYDGKPMRRREFVPVAALEAWLGRQKPRHLEAASKTDFKPSTTTDPVTYIIDYTVNHLDNPGYLKTLTGAPPQFLHVGQDTPFAGASGPVVVAKELTYVGLDLLTPKQLRARTRSIKKFVASVHAAGVEKGLPLHLQSNHRRRPSEAAQLLAFLRPVERLPGVWNSSQTAGRSAAVDATRPRGPLAFQLSQGARALYATVPVGAVPQ
jgi:hypothetical protein